MTIMHHQFICLLFSSGVLIAQPTPKTYHPGLLLPNKAQLMTNFYEPQFTLPKGAMLENDIEISKYMPPAGDQGAQYSCTAWAVGYAIMTYRENLASGTTPIPDRPADPEKNYSPAFVFNMIKQISQPGPCTTGVNFTNTYTVCNLDGNCMMSDMPYTTQADGCEQIIPSEVIALASKNTLPIPKFIGKTDFVQWRWYLEHDQPIVVQFAMDTAFVYGGFGANERHEWFTWDYDEAVSPTGGHCVVVTDYDPSDSTFILLNSFGLNWGTLGYAKVTQEQLGARCFGACVFPNKEIPFTLASTDRMQDKKEYVGNKLKKAFKVGETHVFNGSSLQLLYHDRKKDVAVINFSRTDQEQNGNSIQLAPSQPLVLYKGNERWSISYRDPNLLRQLFHKNVPLKLHITDASDDPELIETAKLIDDLREQIERGQ